MLRLLCVALSCGVDRLDCSVGREYLEIKHEMDKGDKIIEHAHVDKLPENYMPGPNGYSTVPSF